MRGLMAAAKHLGPLFEPPSLGLYGLTLATDLILDVDFNQCIGEGRHPVRVAVPDG